MQLAWRNLWRNARRTILTIVAISFATGIVVFSHGLQVSTHETSIIATTRIFQGALQVQRKDYFDNPQIYRTISEPESLREVITSQEGVVAATPRAIGFALVSSEDRTYGVQVIGVDPAGERLVSTIPSLIREGEYLSDSDQHGVIIGKTLARNLRLSVGAELTMLGQGRDGSLAAAVLPVIGFYESGSPDVDRAIVQMPINTFQDIFYMPEEAHAIIIQIDSLSQLAKVQTELEQNIDNQQLQVLRWDQITPGLKQAQEFDRVTDWIFLFSLIVIVVFGILNALLMSILERTREFGMLLALGMRPIAITRLILLECSQLVVLGAATGSLVGAGVIFYFNQQGFVIPGAAEFLKTWNLPEALYPQITLEALVTGPLIVLICSLVVLLPFSLRPFWLKPIEAMRS